MRANAQSIFSVWIICLEKKCVFCLKPKKGFLWLRHQCYPPHPPHISKTLFCPFICFFFEKPLCVPRSSTRLRGTYWMIWILKHANSYKRESVQCVIAFLKSRTSSSHPSLTAMRKKVPPCVSKWLIAKAPVTGFQLEKKAMQVFFNSCRIETSEKKLLKSFPQSFIFKKKLLIFNMWRSIIGTLFSLEMEK